MRNTTDIVTEYGGIDCCIDYVDSGPLSVFKLNVFVPELTLPEGMELESVHAIMIEIESTVELSSVRMQFSCSKYGAPLYKNTGECVDAVTGELGNTKLSIGTEDTEKLTRRMPWLKDLETPVVDLTNTGLCFNFERVPADVKLSIHAVFAYTINDLTELADWFAVDVDHDQLLRSNKL